MQELVTLTQVFPFPSTPISTVAVTRSDVRCGPMKTNEALAVGTLLHLAGRRRQSGGAVQMALLQELLRVSPPVLSRRRRCRRRPLTAGVAGRTLLLLLLLLLLLPDVTRRLEHIARLAATAAVDFFRRPRVSRYRFARGEPTAWSGWRRGGLRHVVRVPGRTRRRRSDPRFVSGCGVIV